MLLAERELASGRLVRPLEGICEDVTYTGHWLVFPRAKRYSKSIVVFVEWLAKELKMNPEQALVDAETILRP
jgi:DNA-binding transcriptional LysR family regulator